MYRRIVANKIRATFREINAGNYQAMIDSLADSFQYRFHGSHALGGTRTSKKTMILWWERVNRLLPDVYKRQPLDGEGHTVTRNIVVRNMDSVAHTYELSYQYGPEIPGSRPEVPPLVTVEPGERCV